MASTCKRLAVTALGLVLFVQVDLNASVRTTGLPLPDDITWTWMKGSSTVGQFGVYGTLGVPAATNTPGARSYSVSWTDLSGQMWLFGGVTSWDIVDDLWLLSLTPDRVKN